MAPYGSVEDADSAPNSRTSPAASAITSGGSTTPNPHQVSDCSSRFETLHHQVTQATKRNRTRRPTKGQQTLINTHTDRKSNRL